VKVCHIIHDLRHGGAEHLLVDLAGVAAASSMTCATAVRSICWSIWPVLPPGPVSRCRW